MSNPTDTLEQAAHADTAALRALYQRAMDGWNMGSGAAFAAAWTEDGHLIGFDGSHFTSREAIARFHEPRLRTYLEGTRLTGEVTDVQFPAPDVALLHARGGTIMRGASTPAPERDSIQPWWRSDATGNGSCSHSRTPASAPSAATPSGP